MPQYPISLTRRLALKLGARAPFGALARAYYRVALLACSWACRTSSAVRALLAHRGWTRGDWRPGASDLDLFVIFRAGGCAAARAWARRCAALKNLFPMLGEWLSADSKEFAFYLRNGDLRALELAHSARVLCGEADLGPLYSPSEGRRASDAWNECWHAHARLCGLFFSQAGVRDAGLLAHSVRKSLLDLERYGACAGDLPVRAVRSRNECELGLPAGSRVRDILGRLCAGLEEEALLESLVYSMSFLERLAASALEKVRPYSPPDLSRDFIPASAHEREANANFCQELRARLGPALLGGVTDTLFESYFVFDLGPAQEAAQVLCDFRRMASAHPALAGAKMVLGPKSMRLVSAGLKTEDPAACGCHERRVSSAAGVSGEGRFWERHRRAYFLGALDGGWSVKSGEQLELQREAFARMLVAWRFDAFQGASCEGRGQRLFYYWLPRAAAFHMHYVHGRELPCFPAEPLLKELVASGFDGAAGVAAKIGSLPEPGVAEIDACAELVQKLNEAALAAVK